MTDYPKHLVRFGASGLGREFFCQAVSAGDKETDAVRNSIDLTQLQLTRHTVVGQNPGQPRIKSDTFVEASSRLIKPKGLWCAQNDCPAMQQNSNAISIRFIYGNMLKEFFLNLV